jgi:hypothetical protein
MERRKKRREGGKEDPSALIFLPLSTQPYKASPSPYSPLEKFPLLRKPRKEVGRS